MPTGYGLSISAYLVQFISYLFYGLLETMAESIKAVSPIVLLKGSNYSTWKVQYRMVMMKAGLWSIVSGTEMVPESEADAEVHAKFAARRDSELAHSVLSVDPTLLYLLGDPDDPVAVYLRIYLS